MTTTTDLLINDGLEFIAQEERTMTTTTTTKPASDRFKKAMRELRKLGFQTRTGVTGCCRSCIVADGDKRLGYTDDMEAREVPLLWTYAGQGSATADINDGEDLLLNHSFLSLTNTGGRPLNWKLVEQAFGNEGLSARWDGTESQCISVFDMTAVADRKRREIQKQQETELQAELRRVRQAKWEQQRLDREALREAHRAVVQAWAVENLTTPSDFSEEQLEALWAAGTGGTK